MNVAVLGVDKPAQIITEIIEQHYNSWLEQRLGEKLNVVTYVTWGGAEGVNTSNVNNIPILNQAQCALLYKKKVIDKIIFPRESYIYQRNTLLHLMFWGVKLDDIFLASRLNENISVFNLISPYVSAKFIPYIEFHIADHCNLNCHACGHCSSLVQKPVFPVFEKLTKDFEQLHKFIDDIGTIRIMGGEPLLNPEINKYVKFMRKLYPLADIRVVTNAILLPKMPEKFFDTLRENNVSVDISVYPPMKDKIPAIQNLLQSKGVQVGIGSVTKDYFGKNRVIHPHSHLYETFAKCGSAMCNFIYDGKIAACCVPFTTKYFNEYFNQNLPTDGYLNLYDESLTSEKITRYILSPMKACGHCGTGQSIKWRPVKHPVELSDWVTDVAANQ